MPVVVAISTPESVGARNLHPAPASSGVVDPLDDRHLRGGCAGPVQAYLERTRPCVGHLGREAQALFAVGGVLDTKISQFAGRRSGSRSVAAWAGVAEKPVMSSTATMAA